MTIRYDLRLLFYGPDVHNQFSAGDNVYHDTDTEKSVVDVTFVDDQCYIIFAKSPAASNTAINVFLRCVTRAFYDFGFDFFGSILVENGHFDYLDRKITVTSTVIIEFS